ncbi:MAG: RNA 2',3'-cyclic phosphodiesterase [Spirochaetota bacterium]|nr:RNA 2',3'-cyclic phosphodiesterase [Spirochaetota bacterium]
MARLFIALPLEGEGVTSPLKPIVEYLNQHNQLLKVVSTNNYHITIKFLGECDENKANKIIESFPNIELSKGDIPFRISGIGAFPEAKRASVIWCGIKTDARIIDNIFKDIENFSSHFGFQKEKRRFIPHLTLARVRKGKRMTEDIVKFIEKNSDRYFGESSFKKLVLYSSNLTPKGPQYTELKYINLR